MFQNSKSACPHHLMISIDLRSFVEIGDPSNNGPPPLSTENRLKMGYFQEMYSEKLRKFLFL